MVKDVIFTIHAFAEAEQDGISKNEIIEALSRGKTYPQNGKFITIYKYFTVIYKIRPDGKYKIITVYSGYPGTWKH